MSKIENGAVIEAVDHVFKTVEAECKELKSTDENMRDKLLAAKKPRLQRGKPSHAHMLTLERTRFVRSASNG